MTMTFSSKCHCHYTYSGIRLINCTAKTRTGQTLRGRGRRSSVYFLCRLCQLNVHFAQVLSRHKRMYSSKQHTREPSRAYAHMHMYTSSVEECHRYVCTQSPCLHEIGHSAQIGKGQAKRVFISVQWYWRVYASVRQSYKLYRHSHVRQRGLSDYAQHRVVVCLHDTTTTAMNESNTRNVA